MELIYHKIIQLYRAHQNLICYGIFGVLTTIVNIAAYQILLIYFDYKISNLCAIIFAKVFAYVVNKNFVFRTKCANVVELLHELGRYILARSFTGIIDYFGVILLVEIFHFNEYYVKYFIQIIVILLNYVFGKKAVFIVGIPPKTEENSQK